MAKRKVDNSELLALLGQVETNNNEVDKKVTAEVMSIDETERTGEGISSAKRPNLQIFQKRNR